MTDRHDEAAYREDGSHRNAAVVESRLRIQGERRPANRQSDLAGDSQAEERAETSCDLSPLR